MQGADEYYSLINKSYNLKVGDLSRINCYGYGDGFKHDNVVFILDEHARGKTFKIWIYENSEIQNTLIDEHLEVYGVIGGQNGWNETYGWLHHGIYARAWIGYVENYFNKLKKIIYEKEYKEEIKIEINKKLSEEKLQKKLEKFDNVFQTKVHNTYIK